MTNAWSRPILPPGVLMALPTDVWKDVMTEWLLLRDVCRLDSAVCAKMWRTEWLRMLLVERMEFLREAKFVGSNKLCTTRKYAAVGVPAMNWILKKGLCLASLRIYGFLDYIDMENEICNAIKSLVDQGRLKQLEMIELNCCSLIGGRQFRSYILFDEVLLRMAKDCENLLYLDVSLCSRLEDGVIRKVVESCKKLRYVNLSRTSITDATVVSLCDHCPLLESLYILECNCLSEAAFMSLASSNLRLTSIGLKVIANRFHPLEKVVNKFCALKVIEVHGFSNSNLIMFGKHCLTNHLEVLDLRGCHDVTPEGLGVFGFDITSDKLTVRLPAFLNLFAVIFIRECFPSVVWEV